MSAGNQKRASVLALKTALAAFGLFGTSGLAFAQDHAGSDQKAKPREDQILPEDYLPENYETIVVTARKREESLVEVPEAITAFGAKQIEEAGLRGLRDFSDLTPNINISSGQGIGYPAITVRGLAQAQTGEAPIAVVIDGVQISEPSFITQDFGDVERVEVLRGPQGSLYGRNAIGGAINIVTRQPTEEFKGRMTASYGNANSALLSGQLSGPIAGDDVLFSIGGSFRRTDGQIINLFLNEPADGGEQTFLRGRILFNLSDRLQVDLRSNYGNDDVGNQVAEIVTFDQIDDFNPGFLQVNAPVRETRKLYDLSARIEYSSDAVTLTSITGYSKVKGNNLGDADFSPAPLVIQDVTRRVDAFTQEVRASSAGDRRFRWMVGGFYQDRHTDNFLEFFADDGTGRASNVSIPGTSLDVGTSKSIAGFASASYDVLSALELTVGARYDRDRRTSVDEARPGSAAKAVFSAFQPKIQLSYKPSDNLNIYATYSEGFSSGGFNSFVSVAQSRRYEAQTAENFEIGFKHRFLRNRITLTASAFRVTYHDQQFFFITLSPPSQNILNIDRTRVNGLELDVIADITDSFRLSAALGIADAKIRANSAQPETVGNDAPQNYPYTFNVAAQYTLPLTSELDLRAYASYRRQGETFWTATNDLRTPPKDFINLRLFVEGKRLSVGAFVKNLGDTQYPNIAAVLTGLPIAARLPSEHRTYGAEAIFRF